MWCSFCVLLNETNGFNSLLLGEGVGAFAPVAVKMVFEIIDFFDAFVSEDFHAVITGVESDI